MAPCRCERELRGIASAMAEVSLRNPAPAATATQILWRPIRAGACRDTRSGAPGIPSLPEIRGTARIRVACRGLNGHAALLGVAHLKDLHNGQQNAYRRRSPGRNPGGGRTGTKGRGIRL